MYEASNRLTGSVRAVRWRGRRRGTHCLVFFHLFFFVLPFPNFHLFPTAHTTQPASNCRSSSSYTVHPVPRSCLFNLTKHSCNSSDSLVTNNTICPFRMCPSQYSTAVDASRIVVGCARRAAKHVRWILTLCMCLITPMSARSDEAV